MNWICALSVLFVFLFHGVALSQSSQLVSAAAKEGTLKFYGPSTLTHDGVQLLAQAFNKKHATNIKVTYYPSKSMTAEVNKMIGLSATGIEPEYDVMAIIDGLHGALWTKKLHVPFDYASLGIDPKTIHFDSGTVSVANQIVLPGYNTKQFACTRCTEAMGGLARSKMERSQNRYPNSHRPNGLLGNQVGRAKISSVRYRARQARAHTRTAGRAVHPIADRRDRYCFNSDRQLRQSS